MNRPDQLNAINLDMLGDFRELFALLARNDQIRVIVITGAGRGFCSGADLNDAVTHKDSEVFADPETFMRTVQESYGSLILGMRRIPQPVIAAVNGPAENRNQTIMVFSGKFFKLIQGFHKREETAAS